MKKRIKTKISNSYNLHKPLVIDGLIVEIIAGSASIFYRFMLSKLSNLRFVLFNDLDSPIGAGVSKIISKIMKKDNTEERYMITAGASAGLAGSIYFTAMDSIVGISQVYYSNFIICGMAAIMTAVVRSPIISILLVSEMTGNFTHILGLCIVSIVHTW